MVGKNALKTRRAPSKLPLTWHVRVGSGAHDECRHLGTGLLAKAVGSRLVRLVADTGPCGGEMFLYCVYTVNLKMGWFI